MVGGQNFPRHQIGVCLRFGVHLQLRQHLGKNECYESNDRCRTRVCQRRLHFIAPGYEKGCLRLHRKSRSPALGGSQPQSSALVGSDCPPTRRINVTRSISACFTLFEVLLHCCASSHCCQGVSIRSRTLRK